MTVQVGLRQTWSENPNCWFSNVRVHKPSHWKTLLLTKCQIMEISDDAEDNFAYFFIKAYVVGAQ